MPLLPQALADLVAQDGLSRQAAGDDGNTYVLYWDPPHVRSLTSAEWLAQRGPLPSDPTQAEIDAGVAARVAAAQQAAQDAAALRSKVLQVAQSAVGVAADQLTNVQLRALFMVVLWKAGALDKNGVVRPLSEWVRD
jgi:hypothetical protein